MNSFSRKLHNHTLRKARIRSRVSGTTQRPRLSVHVSNLHVSAQIIDDTKGKTLAAVNSATSKTLVGSLNEKATWVGAEIAHKAKAAKITTVVFDRNGRLYHGRIKALAEAARAEGLRF